VAIVLIMLNIMIFLNGYAFADTDGAGTVTASTLNMRSKPSASSSVVTCLAKGTVVLVTGKTDGWYKVWYQGHDGYMSTSYINFSENATSSFGIGTIQGTGVRVRSGSGTSNSILGSCNSGKAMPVTGVSGSWYRVSYNGKTGYVHSDYMSISAAVSSIVKPSGGAPSSSGSGSSVTGTISGSCVRLRSGPDTSYSILRTFNSGIKVSVTGTSGNWYQVNHDGTTGYVYKTYLHTGSSSSSSSSGMIYTVSKYVNVRSGPGTSHSILTSYAAGTTVTVTDASGSWYKITYGSGSAYICGIYLTKGAASGSSSGSTSQQSIINEAKKFLGVRYVYGGTSSSGFDCSGFVYYVYKQCGYSICRTATAQDSIGTAVSRSNLEPGDIIIFYNGSKTAIGHAAIYLGNGQFIHASSSAGKVVITSLSATYYDTHYYGARRVVS